MKELLTLGVGWLWRVSFIRDPEPGSWRSGFDAFYASNVQSASGAVKKQRTMQNPGAALLDCIGPAILIAHS